MCTENETYTMPVSRMAEAVRRIEEANRRAERAGIAERFEYTVQFYEERVEPRNGASYVVRMVALTLSRPTLRHEDWEFVATLQWDEEAGLIVRSVPGVELGDRSDFDACRCDVCHTQRQRNDTFVVENVVTRERLQVGRNCLRQFMGIVPAGLWMLTWTGLENHEPDDGEYGRGSHRQVRFPVEEVLLATVEMVRQHGWVSRGKADEFHTPTVNLVSEMLYPVPTEEGRRWAAEMWRSARTEANVALATLVRETALEADGDSDFITNLRQLLRAATVDPRNLGIVCAAYAVYDRVNRERLERSMRVPSEWIGQVGQKLTVTGTVAQVREIDGQYGPTTLVVLKCGNDIVKWFASGAKDFRIGQALSLKGTVKSHGEFRGQKETMLTRCKEVECAD